MEGVIVVPITTGGAIGASLATEGVTVAPLITKGAIGTGGVPAALLTMGGVIAAPLTAGGVTASGSTSSELLSSITMGESLPCKRAGLSQPVVVSSSKILCSKVMATDDSPDGPAIQGR